MHRRLVQLGVNHKIEIRNLLQREPSFNGFIISDLESASYAPELVQIYGEVEGDSLCSAVIGEGKTICSITIRKPGLFINGLDFTRGARGRYSKSPGRSEVCVRTFQ